MAPGQPVPSLVEQAVGVLHGPDADIQSALVGQQSRAAGQKCDPGDGFGIADNGRKVQMTQAKIMIK